MTIEEHLKQILGEQLFALAARSAEIDRLQAAVTELHTKLADLERPKPMAPDSPFHLARKE